MKKLVILLLLVILVASATHKSQNSQKRYSKKTQLSISAIHNLKNKFDMKKVIENIKKIHTQPEQTTKQFINNIRKNHAKVTAKQTEDPSYSYIWNFDINEWVVYDGNYYDSNSQWKFYDTYYQTWIIYDPTDYQNYLWDQVNQNWLAKQDYIDLYGEPQQKQQEYVDYSTKFEFLDKQGKWQQYDGQKLEKPTSWRYYNEWEGVTHVWDAESQWAYIQDQDKQLKPVPQDSWYVQYQNYYWWNQQWILYTGETIYDSLWWKWWDSYYQSWASYDPNNYELLLWDESQQEWVEYKPIPWYIWDWKQGDWVEYTGQDVDWSNYRYMGWDQYYKTWGQYDSQTYSYQLYDKQSDSWVNSWEFDQY